MKRLVLGAAVAGVLTVANSIPTSLVQQVTSYAAGQLRVPARAATAADIVATARAYLHYPYATIGDSPSQGFSCIGFVHFVFGQNGVNVPYDIPAAWNSAPHVQLNDLQPGDILFYSNTVFAGLSHVAIYIGNGQMIGADNFQVGVHLDNIYDKYWMDHYYGATRPLAALGIVPAAQTQDLPAASSTPTQQPTPATAPVGTRLQIVRDSAAVYSGPGYQYTTIGTLPANASVTVVGEQASWYDVKYADPAIGTTYGFIYAGDLGPAGTAAGPTGVPTSTPTPDTQLQLSTASAVSAASRTTLIVARGPLNVRRGPGKNFALVGSLKKGARVLEIERRDGWAHVQAADGIAGWVALNYMATASATDQHETYTTAETLSPGTHAALVTAAMLYVRATPTANGAVLTVLFSGETVRVVETHSSWDKVQMRNGGTGWAYASYLRIQ